MADTDIQVPVSAKYIAKPIYRSNPNTDTRKQYSCPKCHPSGLLSIAVFLLLYHCSAQLAKRLFLSSVLGCWLVFLQSRARPYSALPINLADTD